jgi:hypothetical protein
MKQKPVRGTSSLEKFSPDNSSPENSSLEKKISGGGKFFAGAFFARTKNSSLEKKFPGGGKFFAGAFFARMSLHRIILR